MNSHQFWLGLDNPRYSAGNATLPVLTAAGGARRVNRSGGNAILPVLTASGVARKVNQATGNAVLPILTASGVARKVNKASGSVSLPVLNASGAGKRVGTASGNASLPVITAAGAAKTRGRVAWAKAYTYRFTNPDQRLSVFIATKNLPDPSKRLYYEVYEFRKWDPDTQSVVDVHNTMYEGSMDSYTYEQPVPSQTPDLYLESSVTPAITPDTYHCLPGLFPYITGLVTEYTSSIPPETGVYWRFEARYDGQVIASMERDSWRIESTYWQFFDV